MSCNNSTSFLYVTIIFCKNEVSKFDVIGSQINATSFFAYLNKIINGTFSFAAKRFFHVSLYKCNMTVTTSDFEVTRTKLKI